MGKKQTDNYTWMKPLKMCINNWNRISVDKRIKNIQQSLKDMYDIMIIVDAVCIEFSKKHNWTKQLWWQR